ncbi:TPA: hypothetical protein ACKMKV_002251, partial [Neisseria gonorrhoeae]
NKGLAAACRFKQSIALTFGFVRSASRTNCIGSGNADCADYTGNIALAHALTHSCVKLMRVFIISSKIKNENRKTILTRSRKNVNRIIFPT